MNPDGYEIKINGGETVDTLSAVTPGDIITDAGGGGFIINGLYRLIDGIVTWIRGDEYESYTVTENDFYISEISAP